MIKTSNSVEIGFVKDNMYMIYLAFVAILIDVSSCVPLGGNLDALRDWSRSLPYVNLIRQARGWGSADTPWIANASFDRITGWPISDFGVQVASVAVDLGGTYLLTAKGNADISYVEGSKQSIVNKTYDATTNTLTAFIVARQGASVMTLRFVNTTGPGLQDVSLLQPGYNLSTQSNLTDLMLAHLSRFNILRFMEWTDTNENFEVNWNDTTPVNWPFYRPPTHNPWQTIPYIANQLNKSADIWVNIPHLASDDYVINLARFMLREINSTTSIYIEYSNEVWNYEFPQEKYNADAANDSVRNHGDPFHFAYDNSTDVRIWALQRIAYQTKRLSDLFKTVFGEDNVCQWKRIRPISCGQADTPSYAMEYLEYLSNVYGSPRNFLYGIAVAPYFSLGPHKAWSNLTTDQVLDGMNISIETYLPEQGWSQQHHWVFMQLKQLGINYRFIRMKDDLWKLFTRRETNATRHSRLTDICVRFLDG